MIRITLLAIAVFFIGCSTMVRAGQTATDNMVRFSEEVDALRNLNESPVCQSQ